MKNILQTFLIFILLITITLPVIIAGFLFEMIKRSFYRGIDLFDDFNTWLDK